MRLAFIFILSLLSLQALFLLQAQPNKFGVPMITNYPYNETGGSEQNWCITQDHRGVIYVGNYDKGIQEYDGVEWRSIAMPKGAPVLSLVCGDDGVVYVGADGDFGLLEADLMGELHFRSLCDSVLREKKDRPIIVWKTYAFEKKIWFCTHDGIYIFKPTTADIELIETPENAYHSYIADGRLYNSDWGEGLMVYESDHFERVPGGDFFHEMAITGLEHFASGYLLVSTLGNGIYLFNTQTGVIDDSFLSRELMEDFREMQITYTKLLEKDLLVCTYSNGLYILDRDGKVNEIISESEGLIDNTIIQVYTDDRISGAGPLWIAHWKGVSKIEANNPFRVFTERSGFESLITDIVQFNDVLFVSTMSGLYYKSSSSSGDPFRKLSGISSEVNDLHLFQPGRGRSMLLASTFTETFVIDRNMRVSSLKENMVDFKGSFEDLEQIAGRYILNDPEQASLIYTGYNHVVGLQYSRGRWKEVFTSDKLNGEIHHMAKDRYGYLWVSTPSELIRIDTELSPAFTMKSFSSKNGLPFDDDNNVFLKPETKNLMVGTRNGFYRFNYFQERFSPDSLFNSVLPPGANIIRAFHHDRDGDYWFSFENEHSGWTEMVVRNTDEHLEVIFEKPFQRLPSAASADLFFSQDESGVWFSKSDELYHFDKTFSRKDTFPFHALIRKVIISNDSVLYNGGFSIEESRSKNTRPYIKYRYNNIEFHWSATFFEQEDHLEFSYFLDGFSKEWSGWQGLTFKEFTNLRYGRYTLYLKARNVYGMESEKAGYAFVITRPWYATIAAIIGYILLSGLLVYLLVRLYTKRLTMENLSLEGVIEEQGVAFEKVLLDRMGEISQIDDLLVMGLRINPQ